jgi:D-alanine-D-alanine ligase
VLITGGWSKERDRALLSGRDAEEALRALGMAPRVVDLEGDRDDLYELLRGAGVAFLAIAGRGAEDGRLQGLLETLGVPYTGSGVLASAVSMHKADAKTLVAAAGVVVANGIAVDQAAKPSEEAGFFIGQLGLPVIVKPLNEGGSIGVRIARSRAALKNALEDGAGSALMVESYHEGQSVSVGVLTSAQGAVVRLLPPLETESADVVYSYEAKRGMTECTYYCPARIAPETVAVLHEAALTAHRALDCHSYSRHDFVVPSGGSPVWLEVNTLPGLSRHGNLARMAAADGMAYEELLQHILRGAFVNRRDLP